MRSFSKIVEQRLLEWSLDPFTAAYVEAALYDYDGEGDDSSLRDTGHSVDNINVNTLNNMILDCKSFQMKAGHLIWGKLEDAGHDFWLARNHHGAGFWDGKRDCPSRPWRDWGAEDGKALTALAHSFGEYDLYVGDNGQIYGRHE